MLPKAQRLDKKTMEKVFSTGRFVASSGLSLKYYIDKGLPRVAFIAPKSVARLAVTRNSLRRKGYAIIRGKMKELPQGFVGAFVFKVKNPDLRKEIEEIIHKIH